MTRYCLALLRNARKTLFVFVACPFLTYLCVAQAPTSAELAKESTVFSLYSSLATIPDIVARSRAQGAKGVIRIVRSEPDETHGGHETGRDTELDELLNNAAGAIIGHPISHTSYLTVGASFIFTRYLVVVDKVIKNSPQGLKKGDRIVIARAGGELPVDGRTVLAMDPDAIPIAPNKETVFILYRVPDSPTYFTTSNGVFRLDGASVTGGRRSRVDVHDTPDHFIARLDESSVRSRGNR